MNLLTEYREGRRNGNDETDAGSCGLGYGVQEWRANQGATGGDPGGTLNELAPGDARRMNVGVTRMPAGGTSERSR